MLNTIIIRNHINTNNTLELYMSKLEFLSWKKVFQDPETSSILKHFNEPNTSFLFPSTYLQTLMVETPLFVYQSLLSEQI